MRIGRAVRLVFGRLQKLFHLGQLFWISHTLRAIGQSALRFTTTPHDRPRTARYKAI